MVLERPKNLSLAKFLYATSERNLNFALKAYWIFTGYANERRIMKEDYLWPATLAEQIEMRMVNGNLRSFSSMAASNIDLSLVFNEKIYRAEYISLQNAFVESLTNAAIRLKGVDEKTRNAALAAFFVERNRWVDQQTRELKIDLNSRYKKYYKGIALPFENGDDADPTLALRMVPELGYCYNTRKRSPYKVAFETIKLFEADQWESKIRLVPKEEAKSPETKHLRTNSLNKSMGKSGAFTLADVIDREAYYSAKFKGFDKFAKCIEREEQEMEARMASQQRHIVGSFVPAPARSRFLPRRSYSTEKVGDYMRSQMKYAAGTIAPRRFSDIDIQSILEKYGKKETARKQPAEAGDEVEYIPLEKRLEGMADPFGESWEETVARYRKTSEYGQFDSYDIRSYIVKGNDDLRQELMAIQFMKQLQQIYRKAGIQIFLRPYEILITSHNSGILGTHMVKSMVEFVSDTVAVDSLKKRFPAGRAWSLNDFYRRYFYDRFEEAQKNFVESLAGYSIFNYLLQVKDRHNANILIDRHGHIIHIDFGFFISNYPGGINFESAPFKLTDVSSFEPILRVRSIWT